MIIFIIVLFSLLSSATPQYQSGWDILLNHQPTSIRVNSQGGINKQHILVGLFNGTLLVLSAHFKTILKTVDIFDEQIRQIEVDNRGISFIAGLTLIAELDCDYNIITVLHIEGPVKLIGLTRSANKYFLNYEAKSTIYTREYPNITNVKEDVWLSTKRYSIAIINSNQEALFAIGQDGTQFAMYKLTNDAGNKDRQYESKRNLQSLTSINRKFNFKVVDILLDYKSSFGQEDALLITDDETIFYTRSGNIITYVPYRNFQNDHLVAVEYCEDIFIVILHSRETENMTRQYYITLVRTDDLTSLKILTLNDLFGGDLQIEGFDCNHNLLVFQTKQPRLLVIQRYSMFSVIQHTFELAILTVLFALAFLFCRFQKKEIKKSGFADKEVKEEQIVDRKKMINKRIRQKTF